MRAYSAANISASCRDSSWQSVCHYNTELRLRLPRLSGTLPRRGPPSVAVGAFDLRGCGRLSGTLPSWL